MRNIKKYYAASTLALLIWSTSFIGTKIAYSTFPPLTLGALRFVIASIFLGIALIIKREFAKPTFKDLGVMSLSGALGITLYFAMQNIGVSLTTASSAALIVASYPAVTTLLELIIYNVKPSATKVVGIFIAMAGVFILSFSETDAGDGDGKDQFIGNLILIATGFVWTFYNFVTQKVVNKYPAITVSFYQTIAGTILFLPLILVERHEWVSPTLISFSALIYLGVLCSVVAFMFYNFGLRKIPPSTSVTLMNLVPIFGVIFSVLILHETITLQQLAGGVITIAGVLLSVK
ncbi:hypothetical protein SRRS_18110 [Sporomusa rhizae]|uniref:DMT family transporter n=1 Tax=Sporomusa rhizae TaxID=357999 RepID=UPI00352AA464